MSGGPDPLYVRARTALLDAADALAEQLDAVVLVGAQAIYLHTGDADFATAEHTTDADFCVAPAQLRGQADPRQIAGGARVLAHRTPRGVDEPGWDLRRPDGSRTAGRTRFQGAPPHHARQVVKQG